MISLSDKEYSILNQQGYVLLDQPFGAEVGCDLERIAKSIEGRVKSCGWPYVRVYHPKIWCDDVAGIEAPFNQEIHETRVEKYLKEIDFSGLGESMGWSKTVMRLVRIHRSPKHVKYAGNWHQDMVPNEDVNNGLQIVFYLRDESGFRLVPLERTDEVISKFPNGSWQDWVGETGSSIPATFPSSNFESVEAKAGDVFIFKSGLFHQGVEFGNRFHYHMRIIPEELYRQNSPVEDLTSLDFINVDVVSEYRGDATPDLLKERLPEIPSKGRFQKFISDLAFSINYFLPVRNFLLKVKTRKVDRRLEAEGKGIKVWRYSNTFWQRTE